MLKRWMVAAGLGVMLTAGTGMAFGQGPLQVAAAEAGATQAKDAEPQGTMIAPKQPVMGRRITFDLEDEKGKVTQDSFRDKYLLLAVGYSSCPDICPTTLFEYGEVMKALKNPDAIVPVFVTIDPVNDDAKRLNSYVHFFDERIVGLAGSAQNIRALADQLGATYGYRLDGKKLDKPEKGVPYSVYHSALIYLISPDRRLVDVYDYQLGPEALTQALDEVLGEPAKAGGDAAGDMKHDGDMKDEGGMKHDGSMKDGMKHEGEMKQGDAAGDGQQPASAAASGEAA